MARDRVKDNVSLSPLRRARRTRGLRPRALDVVLVYKKSQLRLALEKQNAHIAALLQRDDVCVRPMRAAHEAHESSVVAVERALKDAGCRVRRVYRARLKPEHCRGRLLITVGGDGTLLDASHKVEGGVALGVNSDTAHSVGFLCAADAESFPALLDDILCGRREPLPLQRLAGDVDGRPLPFPVLNEVLISHKNPASTSRYLVGRRDIVEDHKSSGVFVSTATGSTAAMASAGGEIQPLADRRLQWRVREPFLADGPAWQHEAFFFDADDEVVVTSRMREGRVWLDGPHSVVDLPMGARLRLHGRCAPLRLYTTETMAERRARALAHAARRQKTGC